VRRLLVLVTLAGLVTGSCGRDEPLPASADLVATVTQDRADRAVLGLCEIPGATDPDTASATFQDRAHQTLHDLAAAAEEVDRAAAGELLRSKQRVEADLAEVTLPAGFGADVDVLLAATRRALEVVGLDAPACPA
jgi:hypothetical protein